MNLSDQYYSNYAAAYVRGMAIQSQLELPTLLLQKELDGLTREEIEEILSAGKNAGLKLYRFKNAHDELPRVRRVLGFLRSIEMNSLLDVGSGRGVFLWPCMNLFPYLNVLSIDILPHRVNMIKTVQQGGIFNLDAIETDICKAPVDDKLFDVVTLLEVLEHIPDVSAAVRSAVRIAKKYVVVTVPSKPDNNPEHIHLLTKDKLTELFSNAGCERLHFDGVSGHLVMIAALII
jgi:2-polyprenyl-3-methyl-5-hydroxy-6-metoxy-1,4-benzoquinol methylase